MFPSEFDYYEHFKAYRHIGKEKHKEKGYYCKDYATWAEHITVAYHSINDKNSKLQLAWAFREDLNHQTTYKECVLGVLVTILIVIPSSVIPLVQDVLSRELGVFYICMCCMSILSAILFMIEGFVLFDYFNHAKRARYDEEALRIINSIK